MFKISFTQLLIMRLKANLLHLGDTFYSPKKVEGFSIKCKKKFH